MNLNCCKNIASSLVHHVDGFLLRKVRVFIYFFIGLVAPSVLFLVRTRNGLGYSLKNGNE